MTQRLSALTGMERIPSACTFDETVERFEKVLFEKGIRLFAQIDHAAEAEKVGMSLRPTRVLIFGNPRAGTPLMQAQQSIALDLPLRVLIAEDEDGEAWIFWYGLKALAKRHGVEDNNSNVETLDANLTTLIQAVVHAKNT